jgi:hypothetical protein
MEGSVAHLEKKPDDEGILARFSSRLLNEVRNGEDNDGR